MKLTLPQVNAINKMNQAIKACANAKLQICVMDSSILYAAESLLNEHPEFGDNYHKVADAYKAMEHQKIDSDDNRVGCFNRGNLVIDGGGW